MKIVKRDGSIQEFNVKKLNQWADWGSEECGVSWTDIVLDAYTHFHDMMESSSLQDLLIEECLNRRDVGHTKMAARLMIGKIYKEAFGDFSIPSLKDFYKEAVEECWWADLGYTDEELDELDKYIDHTKDFTYAYASLKQMYDKYFVESGRKVESPQFMFMGISMALMKNEKDRIGKVIKEYQLLSDLKQSLPTPTLNGVRTPLEGSPSCTVISAADNTGSIGAALHLAYSYTAARSGIGVEFDTRAPLEPVKGGRVEHGGKYSIYNNLQASVNTLTQVTRGGSATVTYTCLDPEVLSLLTMKQQRTSDKYRIDHLDYSLAVNDLFLKKVATNDDWILVSSYFAPKLHELFYANKPQEFEAEYERVKRVGGKWVKIVKARDTALQFIEARSDTGRNYMTFIDNMNSHTPFIESVRLSNLCVAPETLILTDNGYEIISDLAGEKVNVWNGKEFSEVEVFKTGENQKLVTVKTNSGFELTCTPYHKFYVSVRSPSSGNTKIVEKRAHELLVGDKLIKCDFPIIEGSEKLDNAYANGFYSGDGCLTKQGKRIYLYGEKRKLKPYFGEIFKSWYVQDNQDREYGESLYLKDKFFVPTSQYCVESRVNWFEGLCDSDGTVTRNGNTQSIQVGNTNKDFLLQTQMMLQTIGVSSKVTQCVEAGKRMLPLNDGSGELGEFECKDAYRLLIGQTGINNLQSLGFNPKRLILTDHKPNRECAQFVKITDVVDDGRTDDTYCFTEPKRNMGVFNGILTGQCQEVMLPTKPYNSIFELDKENESGEVALCFLAAHIVDDYTDEEWEELAYYTALSVDNTIENSAYPFTQVAYTAKKRRSIGVGLSGIGSWMAKNGYKYDDIEGRNAIHRIAEKHSYYLHKASVKLAKERGACEWYNRTKYSNGWLPIDTYKKFVDEHHTQELLCDWEGLRKDIARYGMRFSVLEAHMPCESSSLLNNRTNGLYPARRKDIIKQSRKGSIYWSVPHEDKLQNYQWAWDIDSQDLAKVYGIVQKFTGQGISADFYHDFTKSNNISANEMLKLMLLSAKLGMKSWYYLNFKTNKEEDQVTSIDDSGECESCKM